MACGIITQNFTLSCADPIVPGIDGRAVYLFNYDDWKEATIVNVTNKPLQIESIAFETSTIKGFKVDQPGINVVNHAFDKTEDVGITRYKHMITFLLAKGNADAAEMADKLAKGRFIAAVRTRAEEIIVLGRTTGLRVPDGTMRDFSANSSSYTITLESDEAALEGFPPSHFVGTTPSDLDIAWAEFEALITA